MHNHGDIFISGEWRRAHSDARLAVHNPVTAEIWAQVPDGDSDDISAAVAAARAAYDSWSSTAPSKRAKVLEGIAAALEAHGEEFANLTTRENGTPISETAGAARYSAAHLRIIAELAPTLEREDVRSNPVAPTHTVISRTPVGVAGLITPWNFPLPLIIAKLGPALLAGCTVVLKPAPETPMAARLLMELMNEAGVPRGVVNMVTGGPEAGRALVADPRIDKISFTGSTAAGREIGEVCGRMLRPVTLELGGKSAAIVLDDADIDVIRANILKVSLRNTGQTCKAATRLLVPKTRKKEIVEAVAEVIGNAPVGDPFDPKSVFGPVVSARQRDRVIDYIGVGIDEGATPVVGGLTPPFDHGYYVSPTLFDNVTNDMRIAREEIFGPVLSVISYQGDEEAVRLANDSDYGLSGAVFGTDERRASDIARRIDTGAVGINHYGSNPAAPFSGHKASGVGVEFGEEGLATYLNFNTLHLQGH